MHWVHTWPCKLWKRDLPVTEPASALTIFWMAVSSCNWNGFLHFYWVSYRFFFLPHSNCGISQYMRICFFPPAPRAVSLRPWLHWQWREKQTKKVRAFLRNGVRDSIKIARRAVLKVTNGSKLFIAPAPSLSAERDRFIHLKIRLCSVRWISAHN